MSIVNRTVLACTTTRVIRHNKVRPWIDAEVLKMARRKRSLWQRYLRARSDREYQVYRSYSNYLSTYIHQAKIEYERKMASPGNRKQFYKYIRSSMCGKVSIPMIRNGCGELCGSQSEVADELAEAFSSSFSIEPHGLLPKVQASRCAVEVSDVEVDEELVRKYLRRVRVDSAPGIDGITCRLLQNCADSLALPLSRIFSCSLKASKLPADWLKASVTPIFKKGDKFSPQNYRPISLLSTVAKVLERILCDHIIQFAAEHDIIPREQHGFTPGRSTLTNLMYCVDAWTKAWDLGLPVDVLYLDFSRAFDRVPHRRLLHKLQHLGIRGRILAWIEAFLSNRSFRVRVDKTLSTRDYPVTSGVPQGSVLGPVLFCLYTYDLPRLIRSDCSLFADDTKIYNFPLSHSHILQHDLDNISAWCKDWLLPLNVDKCCVMHIGKNNPRRSYNIDGRTLEEVSSHCDLGLTITGDLRWTEHISTICAKAKRITYAIQKTFRGSDVTTIRMLYTTYVRPILEYVGPVWWPSTRGDEDLLESVQRWNTRIPYRAYRPSYEHRLRLFRLPSFRDRRERGDLITTYRSLHGHFGEDFCRMFERNTNNLRGHSYKLRKENFRTTQRQNFLPNRVFESWNRLPVGVVEAESVNRFKNSLDEWTLVRVNT